MPNKICNCFKFTLKFENPNNIPISIQRVANITEIRDVVSIYIFVI